MTWSIVNSLINGESDNDEFGTAVAISGDGTVIAAGAPFAYKANQTTNPRLGEVTVYKNNSGTWEVYGQFEGVDDGDVYLRSLMHADGNIQYANYQNQTQMSDYLTGYGYESVISDII